VIETEVITPVSVPTSISDEYGTAGAGSESGFTGSIVIGDELDPENDGSPVGLIETGVICTPGVRAERFVVRVVGAGTEIIGCGATVLELTCEVEAAFCGNELYED